MLIGVWVFGRVGRVVWGCGRVVWGLIGGGLEEVWGCLEVVWVFFRPF